MSDPTTPTASFADLIDKSLARGKDTHEKMNAVVQSMTDSFEEAISCATKGSAEYRMKVMEIARAHANAAFDAALGVMTVKSPAELAEISSTHTRKQLELAAEQMKELATLTQRVVNETAAPIRTGMSEPFKLAS